MDLQKCLCIPDTNCLIVWGRNNLLSIRWKCNRCDSITMACEGLTNLLQCLCIPDANCVVSWARNNLLSIRWKDNRSDPITMACKGLTNLLQCSCIPDTNCLIIWARNNFLSIKWKSNRCDPISDVPARLGLETAASARLFPASASQNPGRGLTSRLRPALAQLRLRPRPVVNYTIFQATQLNNIITVR